MQILGPDSVQINSDKIVALHPHCSRGRYAHYKASLRLWLKVCLPLLLFMYLLTGAIAFFDSVDNWTGIVQMWALGGLGILAILGAIAFRISRKLMGFVSLAEGIFQGFGWKDVKDIDLPAITKKSKASGEPGALGILYFRY